MLYSVSTGNYSSNTFCLFLPYQDEENTLLRHSLHFRLILHIFCVMFMSIIAHLTLLELISSQFKDKQRSSAVLYSLVNPIIVNVICLLPLDLIFMFGSDLSPSIIAWSIVCLMPINSLLNPIILTLVQINIKSKLLSKCISPIITQL